MRQLRYDANRSAARLDDGCNNDDVDDPIDEGLRYGNRDAVIHIFKNPG